MSDPGTVLRHESTERLLTVPEVAEWLGISEWTLRGWRHMHRGPRSLSVGGAVRYRPRDVDAWLEQRARRSDDQ